MIVCRQPPTLVVGEPGRPTRFFENLRDEEPHIYLLPEYTFLSERGAPLDVFWPAIFETMLEGCVTDESLWPADRTRELFDEWFEVQITSVIEDLDADEPLAVS